MDDITPTETAPLGGGPIAPLPTYDNPNADERASILSVIAQERTTIAYYRALLKTKALRAEKVRWRALKRKHAGYVQQWERELRRDQTNA